MADTTTSKKGKILAIDDDQFIRKMFHSMLENKGYQVYSAKDGSEGVEMTTQLIPDVIFLDIMMPELDGFQALEMIRKNKQTKNIPIIIVTARADSDTLLKAIKLGANDFIAKPFTRNMIMQKVRFAMKKPNQQETGKSSKVASQNKATFIDVNAFNNMKLNFINSFEREFMEMIRLFSQQKRPELRRKLSEIEKACSTYEISQPLSMIGELQYMIENSEWDHAVKTMEKVYAMFQSLKAEIESELN